MDELVSIIVPVYNAEKYIKKCIESIINQTYKKIEVVIVDDGSKDNSVGILKKYEYDDRIKLILTKNHGVSTARNVAIEKCNGNFIMFADADDWLEPNAVEVLLNVAISTSAEIVQAGYYRNENEKIKLSERQINGNNIQELREKILFINSMEDT